MTRRRTYVHKQRRPKLPPGLRRLRKEACAGLQAELDETIGQLHQRVREIAEKYKKSVAWVRTHLFGGGKSARFVRRELKIRLYDVYVHIKTKQLNADREVGDKYSLPEIKAKIAKERPYYKNRPREDHEAWIAEYKADKEAKAREPRVNRKGEQQDAAATLKRVSTDLDTALLPSAPALPALPPPGTHPRTAQPALRPPVLTRPPVYYPKALYT
ncbi:hypothetical protein AURDEDRAFT_163482 [Auricularia subglabra TFB-10046 SS5]|nr:hypothetical protein AURDEDRAFT_163482 [Auricularia subglabra TFB-10046 SS5]